MKGDLFFSDPPTFIGTLKKYEFKFKGDLFKDKPIDYNVFGENSKTYIIPLPSLLPPPLPAWKALPAELDIDLPGLKYIGLEACAGSGKHKSAEQFGWVLGHAHVCPHDPDKGMICTKQEYLRNSDGTYSNILLHEVAHLLTDYGITGAKCTTYEIHKYNGVAIEGDVSDWSHNEKWKEWAVKLGAEPSRYGRPPNKYS